MAPMQESDWLLLNQLPKCCGANGWRRESLVPRSSLYDAGRREHEGEMKGLDSLVIESGG